MWNRRRVVYYAILLLLILGELLGERNYIIIIILEYDTLWISKYLNEIELPISRPIMIHTDNNRSIFYSLNDKNHWRTKYIDIRHHFVKDQVKWENITF